MGTSRIATLVLLGIVLAGCTNSSETAEESLSPGGSSSSSAASPAPDATDDDATGAPEDGESAETSEADASAAAEAADQPVATASPSKVQAGSGAADSSLEVQLSSASATPNQPVEVVVVAPKALEGEAVYFAAPAEDGSLMLVSLPMTIDKQLRAQTTFNLGETTTLRAVVLKKDPPDDTALLPKDVERVAESSDFTITIG